MLHWCSGILWQRGWVALTLWDIQCYTFPGFAWINTVTGINTVNRWLSVALLDMYGRSRAWNIGSNCETHWKRKVVQMYSFLGSCFCIVVYYSMVQWALPIDSVINNFHVNNKHIHSRLYMWEFKFVDKKNFHLCNITYRCIYELHNNKFESYQLIHLMSHLLSQS